MSQSRPEPYLHNVLHDIEYLKRLLNLLPKRHLQKAALVADKKKITTLGYAVFQKDAFQHLIQLWPDMKRLRIIKKVKNQVLASDPNTFAMILEQLPNTHRVYAIKSFRDGLGNTFLHEAAQKPDLLQLLNLLPKSQRWISIQLKNHAIQRVLDQACSRSTGLQILFQALPHENWLDLSTQKVRQESVLNIMARDPQLKSQYCYVACAQYLQYLRNQPILDDDIGRLTLRKIGVIQYAQQLLLSLEASEEVILSKFHQALKAPISLTDQRAVLTVRRDSWLTYFLKCLSVVLTCGYTYGRFFGTHAVKGAQLLEVINAELTKA